MPITAGDYSLRMGSPCIDTGNNAANGTSFDLAGNPRIYGSNIDMGAYEAGPSPTPDGAGIVYVTENGTGNGLSWGNPYPGLSNPLLVAKTNTAIQQIWVAAGTYKPQYRAATTDNNGDPTTDHYRAFVLVNDVKIYGGFVGNEPTIDDRPIPPLGAGGLSTLSGDIDDTVGISGGDACHVVISAGNVGAALLDGFTISGGNAFGSSSIIVNSATIERPYGGGMYNASSSPALTNVTISGNDGGYGGGMYNDNSSPVLTNLTISGNNAGYGGGMSNYNSSPALTNVTISGNRASNGGGGMYNVNSSSPTLANSILWGNRTTTNGANVFKDGSSAPTYKYSLVQGSGSSGWGSFGNDGSDNIDDDPLFVNWIDPASSGWTVTIAGDYRLRLGSPCINAGDTIAYKTARGIANFTDEKDLAGNPRVSNGAIDMGAYETALPVPVGGIIYVTVTGNGTGDGSSWTNAYRGLASPLFAAQTNTAIRQIWVAAGTYKPQYRAAATDGSGNSTTNHDCAFVLVPDVKIYGGFAGGESTIAARPTPPLGAGGWSILSGDLDGDDIAGNLAINLFTNKADNAYHVVISAGAVGVALLDGFTISGGYAANGGDSITVNSQWIDQSIGGGMYNINSSPVLTNVIIRENYAHFNGGGMLNIYSSSPVLTNVTISENITQEGGGMYNNTSSPILTNVTISENIARYGSGMYNNTSSPALTNVTISENICESGGGMYNISSTPTLTNSIVWGNTATNSGNNVYNDASTPTYDYSLVQGSGGSSSWQSSFGNDGSNNIDDDPLFVATAFGDYRLQRGSPCIGVGDTTAYTNIRSIANFTNEKDVAGADRLQHVFIDMGAYESPYKRTLQRATAVLANTVYGTALAPTLIGGSNPAGADTVYLYSALQNGTYAQTPVPVDTGTYWLKGVIEETPAYYADTTAAVSFRITPAALTVIAPTPDINGIVYVTVTGDGNKDGSSWMDAYAGLADPLLVADQQRKGTFAVASTDTIRQIWVAAGTYKPQYRAATTDGSGIPTTDRYRAFVLVPNVKIYGGFAGNESAINQRPTPPLGAGGWSILSGDIDDTVGISGGDACHVVISAGNVGTALLDGFTISGGNADDNVSGSGSIIVNSITIDLKGGGGMVNDNSSPALTNVTISGNYAIGGGGMFNDNSSPTLTNVTISGNNAIGGGGMSSSDNSSPTLTNVTISGNYAADGGGMSNYNSSLVLTNVTISGNSATNIGGGIVNANSFSPLAFTNVTISGNYAAVNGGGMYNENSSPALANCIVWGNTANGSVDNVDNDGSSTPTYAYSVVEGQTLTGTGNLSGASDPLFMAPALASATPTTAGNYRLRPGSPCINAGDTVAYKTARGIANFTDEKDLAGNPRVSNGTIDMGAYERAVSNTGVTSVTVTNTTQPTSATDFYLADCGAPSVQITVTPADSTSQVIYNGTVGSTFTVNIARPDIHEVAYTVQSTDGSEQEYRLQIESRFAFANITGMKFNNVLYVNNNTADNGGYEFTHYEWYRNGQPIGIDQQYYSAGPARTDLLDPAVDYSAAVTTIEGKVLHVCPGRVTLTPTSLRAYPNPVPHGTTVTLESPAADGSLIRLYNITGGLIDDTKQLYNGKAQLTAPQAIGIYVITVDGEMAKVVVE
ncbi:hypothetical protein FACS189467_4520 [Bacteroidia bacterium]|nr:hypothetical protein FACS189467_4520 [Bacteroidia bacterium]